MVGIDSFLALDIRIGKIVAVGDHEKARKPMYVLTVDLGNELGQRQVVAGVKSFYSKEELVGKYIACIVNLDPKNIAGIDSQGMMLAAGEGAEDGISVLTPDKEMPLGSKIH